MPISVRTYVDAEIRIKVPKDLLGLTEFVNRLPEAVNAAAQEGANFWESEAGRRLKTLRTEYQQAIQVGVAKVRRGHAETWIKLNPKARDILFMVEEGAPKYSLRDGFLKSRKLQHGPFKKIPRAEAASLPDKPKIKMSKWMIIPLNVNREAPMTNPIFRTFTDVQPADTMWMHPGFQGLRILDDVAEEIQNRILPQKILDLMDEIIDG